MLRYVAAQGIYPLLESFDLLRFSVCEACSFRLIGLGHHHIHSPWRRLRGGLQQLSHLVVSFLFLAAVTHAIAFGSSLEGPLLGRGCTMLLLLLLLLPLDQSNQVGLSGHVRCCNHHG